MSAWKSINNQGAATAERPKGSSGGKEPRKRRPARNRRLRPATYSIAVYLVIGVGVLQFMALLSVFYFRQVAVTIDTAAPPLLEPVDVAAAPTFEEQALVSSNGLTPVRPLAPTRRLNTPVVAPPTAPRETVVVAQPEGKAAKGRLFLDADAARRAELIAINEEAARFIQEEEYLLADGQLAKAELMNADFPDTLRNRAVLAEKRQQVERATSYWQRLFDLGPDAGDDYNLAKEKLGAMALAVREAASEVARAEPLDRVYVQKIEERPLAGDDPNQFLMKIDVAAGEQSGANDLNRIEFQLFFYERTSDGRIVPTIVRPRTSYEGTEQEWSENRKGALLAEYRLTPELAESQGRQFYGYVLRVSYDGKLQDQRAEPARLARFFPVEQGQ